MKRRFAFVAALIFGGLIAGQAPAQTSAPAKKERVVIQVSTPEQRH